MPRSGGIAKRLAKGFVRLDQAVREPVDERQAGRYAPRMLRQGISLTLILVIGAFGGWLILVLLARLAGADISLFSARRGSIPKAQLFDIVRSTATAAALFGGLFAVLYAYRKQKVEESAGRRADAEALSARYQDAASLLGHSRPAIRLAGVFAMARLADEWPEQRQSCVDVLCAYLRGHAVSATPRSDDSEVHRTILDLIGSHVSGDSGVSDWSHLNFNLRRVRFQDWRPPAYLVFRGRADFASSSFEGTTVLLSPEFHQGADFSGCSIIGSLSLFDVDVVHGDLHLADIVVDRAARLDLNVRSIGKESTVGILQGKFNGVFKSVVEKSRVRQGYIHIEGCTIFDRASFTVQVGQTGDDAKYCVATWRENSFVLASEHAAVSLPQVFIEGGFEEGLNHKRFRNIHYGWHKFVATD